MLTIQCELCADFSTVEMQATCAVQNQYARLSLWYFFKCQSLSKWVVAKANILQLGCGKYNRAPTAIPNKNPFHTKYVYSWGSRKQSLQWMPWEWPETWWGSGRRCISPARTQHDCRSKLCQSCVWRSAQQWCLQNQPVESNMKLKKSIVNKLFRLLN